MKNGEVSLTIRGRKKAELTIERKLNDGQWHRIIINNINKVLTLEVQIGTDGSLLVQKNLKMPRRISAANMMYVGGVTDTVLALPTELVPKLEQFRGCIRRFRVNNSTQDLARPGKHAHVGQCFPRVEKGSYFPGDAYAIYSKLISCFAINNYLYVVKPNVIFEHF